MTQDELTARMAALEDRVRVLERVKASRAESQARYRLAAEERKKKAIPGFRGSRTVDGKVIREARTAAGWTMSELAIALQPREGRDLGPSRFSLSKWETGRQRVPEARAREIIAVFEAAGAVPPAFVFETEKQ
jgi:DNA-binding transcriptional regulator YiaG